jgi:hypothetical protein
MIKNILALLGIILVIAYILAAFQIFGLHIGVPDLLRCK